MRPFTEVLLVIALLLFIFILIPSIISTVITLYKGSSILLGAVSHIAGAI